MIKLYRLTLFVFIFTSGLLYGQKDFQPGYIIKDSGDTLYGLIDYRNDVLMNSVCKFKDSENTITEYTPHEINSFRIIESSYYTSREVNGRRYFLEYLIKGKVNIYYMKDEYGNHFYIDKEGEILSEIPYEEGTKYIGGKEVFYKSKKHFGVLGYYMNDATGMQSRIQSIEKPGYKNLISLAKYYHNALCQSDQCIEYEKISSSFSLLFEPSWSTIKYTGNQDLNNESGSFDFGGNFYLWSLGNLKNTYIKTGFFFYNLPDSINGNYFRIPLQLQYIYSASKIEPKIAFGFDLFSSRYNKENVLYLLGAIDIGVGYRLTNSISLNCTFGMDYTPLLQALILKPDAFRTISYSFDVGLIFKVF
ncbi:MAG: hypothetical protein OEY34_00400 [Cyclobacteriaceae bacterium]|nr:hypothetical protein [Cyclobacteriaceae bacterium]